MNTVIWKNIVLKLFAGAIAGLIYSLFYFSPIFKEKIMIFVLLGFLIGLAVAVSNKIRTVKNIFYAIFFGTLGGLLVIASYSYVASLTTAYPVIPFLIISVLISVGMGLAEKSLVKLVLRLVTVLIANFLNYAVLVFAIIKTYGLGFGAASYEGIQMSVAFIMSGAICTLSIGVGDFVERNIIFSRVFWVISGISIFLLWFFRHWFMDISGFLFFLPIIGGFILPMLIPALLFYKSLEKGKQLSYFLLAMTSLVIWFFWAWFWFNKIDDVTKSSLWGQAMFICLLIVFIGISALCMVRYYSRLAVKNNSAFSLNKRFLWQTWFMGFGIIIVSICLYQIIKQVPDYLRWGFRISLDDVYYIYDPFGLSLQWIILTLPATLKIDNMLSKKD